MPKGRGFGKKATERVTKPEPQVREPSANRYKAKGSSSRLEELIQQRDKLDEELLVEQLESITETIKSKQKNATTVDDKRRLSECLSRVMAVLTEGGS